MKARFNQPEEFQSGLKEAVAGGFACQRHPFKRAGLQTEYLCDVRPAQTPIMATQYHNTSTDLCLGASRSRTRKSHSYLPVAS